MWNGVAYKKKQLKNCKQKNAMQITLALHNRIYTRFFANNDYIVIYFDLRIKFNWLRSHSSCFKIVRKLFGQNFAQVFCSHFVYHWAHIAFWIFDCKIRENLKLKIMLFLFSFVFFSVFLFYSVLSFLFCFVFFIQFYLFI